MKNEIKKAPVTAIRQAGLTLIELTIVLLILIALSGLLLPFVQGFVDKTHDSANTDSLKEVTKQIFSYNNLYSGYPEELESLIVGTAGLATNQTATVPALPTPGVGAIMPAMMNTNLFDTLAVTGPEFTQLNNAGISTVREMWEDAGEGNHTLNATDQVATITAGTTTLAIIEDSLLNNDPSPTAGGAQCNVPPTTAGTALTITANVAPGTPLVDPTAFTGDDNAANLCLAQMLNKKPSTVAGDGGIDVVNNVYVVLGIGNESSLIGRTMAEAPIHFARVGGMNAANRYNHILAVFEVREGRMDGHMAANFVGTMMPMMRLEGIAQAQGSYYAGDGS